MSDPQPPANDNDSTRDDSAPVTFYGDIVPLFRPMDVQCMRNPNVGPVLLLNYQWMSDPTGNGTYPDHANANNVLDHLTGDALPQMPLGGPYWAQDNIDLFKSWMQGGFLEGQQDA